MRERERERESNMVCLVVNTIIFLIYTFIITILFSGKESYTFICLYKRGKCIIYWKSYENGHHN